jgi:hypothetical protein
MPYMLHIIVLTSLEVKMQVKLRFMISIEVKSLR